MTATVPATTPGLATLRAAADEADGRFGVHFGVCPTVRIGRFCVTCDQLDDTANRAETAYRRARQLVAVAS